MISAAPANRASALVADPGSISGASPTARAIAAVAAMISPIPMILRMFVPQSVSGGSKSYHPYLLRIQIEGVDCKDNLLSKVSRVLEP